MNGGHSGRNCPVTIYLDGMLYFSGSPASAAPDVNVMFASDYAAAEYYASAAEVPAEYNATSVTGCGVLLLWSRDG